MKKVCMKLSTLLKCTKIEKADGVFHKKGDCGDTQYCVQGIAALFAGHDPTNAHGLEMHDDMDEIMAFYGIKNTKNSGSFKCPIKTCHITKSTMGTLMAHLQNSGGNCHDWSFKQLSKYLIKLGH